MKNRILEWLGPQQNAIQQTNLKRTEHTGDWFLKSEKFINWHGFEGPNLLYCYGKGGLLLKFD